MARAGDLRIILIAWSIALLIRPFGLLRAWERRLSMPTLHGMRLEIPREALRPFERPLTAPLGRQLLIEVSACGVCRTDLHVADGEIRGRLPIVPGHEIVGQVIALGEDASGWEVGDRVGVPWLAWTCGTCPYCREGRENLCDKALFAGFTRDGGYATHCLAEADYCLPIPDVFGDAEAAPLLCAGLIGYRAYRMAGAGECLGLYGFGAAAHIIAQVAVYQGRSVFAFTRPGDAAGQGFARRLGCVWAGGSDEPAPEPLDAAIIFAAVGPLVPQALRQVRKGGRVVCAGIHMSDIPAFPYSLLWGERSICSVANLTRDDGRAFMKVASEVPVHTHVHTLPLAQANEALARLRAGEVEGALVLRP
ncbi:zinc-dependent alcohol dehydrogenase family protein [Sphingomonas sp. GCM10030256]|uniref:zinc-dependent alcohol dehydrogenase family protein n=1 Tax=Sphingomonas sp. GCM10030256 TaxID=3273427 RepID=UPI00360FD49E